MDATASRTCPLCGAPCRWAAWDAWACTRPSCGAEWWLADTHRYEVTEDGTTVGLVEAATAQEALAQGVRRLAQYVPDLTRRGAGQVAVRRVADAVLAPGEIILAPAESESQDEVLARLPWPTDGDWAATLATCEWAVPAGLEPTPVAGGWIVRVQHTRDHLNQRVTR